MHFDKSFARFVGAPENRSALAALQDFAAHFDATRESQTPLIYLYGPAGTGKSHLVQALVQEVIGQDSTVTANIWDASALDGESGRSILETAGDSDLVV